MYIISILLLVALLSVFFFIKINRETKHKNKIIGINNIKLENAHLLSQKSLAEKEVLLKEIHHRVKNNLQLVMSLLNIQSRESEKNNSKDFLEISQSRITSMALIHETLYQSDNINQVNFKDYLKNLTDAITKTYENLNKKINLELEIDEVYFDIQTAIPLGLIVNELIGNAYKHAFEHREKGTIELKINQNKGGFELQISDNGKGIDFLEIKKHTLGLELVKLLVSQIKGVLQIHNQIGTCYSIQFQNKIL